MLKERRLWIGDRAIVARNPVAWRWRGDLCRRLPSRQLNLLQYSNLSTRHQELIFEVIRSVCENLRCIVQRKSAWLRCAKRG